MKQSFITELGLKLNIRFLSDRCFYLAILLAPLALLLLTVLIPNWFESSAFPLSLAILFSYIVWQPIIEELLFRGVIQGQLIQYHWAKLNYLGFSLANIVASLLFTSVHLFNHSLFWALSVIFPSLIFGYFRDRFDNIYPSLILHSIYNSVYIAALLLLN